MEIILDPRYSKKVKIRPEKIIKKIKIRKLIYKQEYKGVKEFFLIALNINKDKLHPNYKNNIDFFK